MKEEIKENEVSNIITAFFENIHTFRIQWWRTTRLDKAYLALSEDKKNEISRKIIGELLEKTKITISRVKSFEKSNLPKIQSILNEIKCWYGERLEILIF